MFTARELQLLLQGLSALESEFGQSDEITDLHQRLHEQREAMQDDEQGG